MQLSRTLLFDTALAGLMLGLFLRPALADGEITLTQAYYKERSTRVVQPMIDARLDIATRGELSTHVLVDSITSASPAAGALGQAFNEKRTEAGASYLHTLGLFRLGGGLRYSTEPDYQSFFASLRAQMSLAQKNTLFYFTLAQGKDQISNAGATAPMAEPIEGTLDTNFLSFSLSQVVSRFVVVSAIYDLLHLQGFLQNPYRVVFAGGTMTAERHPTTRLRHAVFASVRGLLPATRTALVAGYRLYTDDWGIVGHTPEIRGIQEFGEDTTLQIRYRLHQQSAANFFRDFYNTADPEKEPFLTSDQKLAKQTNHFFGAKINIPLGLFGFSGRLARFRTSARVEYFRQSTSFGNGISAQLGLTIPLSY